MSSGRFPGVVDPPVGQCQPVDRVEYTGDNYRMIYHLCGLARLFIRSLRSQQYGDSSLL